MMKRKFGGKAQRNGGNGAGFFQAAKLALALLRRNAGALLVCGAAFQLLLALLSIPARAAVRAAFRAAGVAFLSPPTGLRLLQSPVCVLLLLGLAAVYAVLVLTEILTVVCCCEYGARGVRVGAAELFAASLRAALAMFRPKNLAVLLLVFVLLPVSGATLTAASTDALRLPAFVADFIRARPLFSLAYLAVLVLAWALVLRWCFALHGMVSARLTLADAARASNRLLAGKRLRTLGYLALWLILAGVFALAVVTLGLAVLALAARFAGGSGAFWAWHTRLWPLACSAGAVFFPFANMLFLSALYYRYGGRVTEGRRETRSAFPAWARGVGNLVLLFFLSGIASAGAVASGALAPVVMAHRAGGRQAPENTLAGLEAAVASGAAYAEVDVRMTADGALIALHDATFRRVAGVDKRPEELTLQEVELLDVGSSFSPRYAGERVPTLQELFAAAQGRIRLMIELKGDALELADRAAALIAEYGLDGECIVASMKYAHLERVKARAPKIATCFVSAVFYGDAAALPAADALAVEEGFVTRRLVSDAHAAGKEAYAWTVNRERAMRKMLARGVDGVITDLPSLALSVAESGARPALAVWLAERFFGSA